MGKTPTCKKLFLYGRSTNICLIKPTGQVSLRVTINWYYNGRVVWHDPSVWVFSCTVAPSPLALERSFNETLWLEQGCVPYFLLSQSSCIEGDLTLNRVVNTGWWGRSSSQSPNCSNRSLLVWGAFGWEVWYPIAEESTLVGLRLDDEVGIRPKLPGLVHTVTTRFIALAVQMDRRLLGNSLDSLN